jgi:histidyl-tRNA synthetase
MTDKCLPKGFHYLLRDDVEHKHRILQAFISESNKIFCQLIEFPPVSFANTFTKGAHLTGDKVYEFKDKSNRNLILTPDSQAHTFNHYLSNFVGQRNIKYSWICPVFRYRNISKRHFYQLGYANVNYDSQNEIAELFMNIRQLINFINAVCSTTITLKIVNPGLVRELIECAFKDQLKASLFYDEIRNLSSTDALRAIERLKDESEPKKDLIKIFSGGMNNLTQIELSLQYRQCREIFQFVNLLFVNQNVNIELQLENLYCSEILSSIGFIVEAEGDKIGDGGIYNIYANRFDSRIKSIISSCTGIEALSRYMKKQSTFKSIAIFLKNYSADIAKALRISDELLKLRFRSYIFPLTKFYNNDIDRSDWHLIIIEIKDDLVSGSILNNENQSERAFKGFPEEKLISLFLP